MKYIILSCFILFAGLLKAQQDSLKVKELEEVRVSVVKKQEIVFKDSKYYILDFYVGDRGTFLIVNHFQKYFVYSLDSAMQIEQKMRLDFHPRRLFEDCFGNVHICSNDSLYHLMKSGKDLFFYEVSPISRYYTFLKNCVGSTDSSAIMKTYPDKTLKLVYQALDFATSNSRKLYTIEDEEFEKSIQSERQLSGSLTGNEKMAEITSPDDMKRIREKMERQLFYKQVLSKPSYNPLFVLDDTLYIFDHLNSRLVVMKENGAQLNSYPVRHHQSKKWAKEIKVDYDLKQFYSVDCVRGGISQFNLLDTKTNAVLRQTKISGQAYIEKTILYKGYVFYTYKEDENATLNRLYRQRL